MATTMHVKVKHLPTNYITYGTSGEVLQKWARRQCIPLPMGATPRAVRKIKELPYGSVYMDEKGNLSQEVSDSAVFQFTLASSVEAKLFNEQFVVKA